MTTLLTTVVAVVYTMITVVLLTSTMAARKCAKVAQDNAMHIKVDAERAWVWFSYCVWRDNYTGKYGFVDYYNEVASVDGKTISNECAIKYIVDTAVEKLDIIGQLNEIGISYDEGEKRIVQGVITDYINEELDLGMDVDTSGDLMPELEECRCDIKTNKGLKALYRMNNILKQVDTDALRADEEWINSWVHKNIPAYKPNKDYKPEVGIKVFKSYKHANEEYLASLEELEKYKEYGEDRSMENLLITMSYLVVDMVQDYMNK